MFDVFVFLDFVLFFGFWFFDFLIVERVFIKRNIFFQQMYKFDSLSPVESQEVALVGWAVFVGQILRRALL